MVVGILEAAAATLHCPSAELTYVPELSDQRIVKKVGTVEYGTKR